MPATKIDLETIELKHGSHTRRSDGMCVLEAVAWVARERHSDHPKCVSPAISAFLRTWNDSLPDEDRQRLKPYILRVIGTATTLEDEERRAWMATDWLAREFAPAWLRLAQLDDHARALESLPELVDDETANAALAVIRAADSAAWSAARSAARSAAWSAARSAARSAAWSAAWSAARSAAWSAAWAAAWSAADSAAWSAVLSAARSAARSAADAAAWSAAWSAARSAARSAADAAAWSAAWSAVLSAARSAADAATWSAAESAARSALQPTVIFLQGSAFRLLDRLIAVGRTEQEAA